MDNDSYIQSICKDKIKRSLQRVSDEVEQVINEVDLMDFKNISPMIAMYADDSHFKVYNIIFIENGKLKQQHFIHEEKFKAISYFETLLKHLPNYFYKCYKNATDLKLRGTIDIREYDILKYCVRPQNYINGISVQISTNLIYINAKNIQLFFTNWDDSYFIDWKIKTDTYLDAYYHSHKHLFNFD